MFNAEIPRWVALTFLIPFVLMCLIFIGIIVSESSKPRRIYNGKACFGSNGTVTIHREGTGCVGVLLDAIIEE